MCTMSCTTRSRFIAASAHPSGGSPSRNMVVPSVTTPSTRRSKLTVRSNISWHRRKCSCPSSCSDSDAFRISSSVWSNSLTVQLTLLIRLFKKTLTVAVSVPQMSANCSRARREAHARSSSDSITSAHGPNAKPQPAQNRTSMSVEGTHSCPPYVESSAFSSGRQTGASSSTRTYSGAAKIVRRHPSTVPETSGVFTRSSTRTRTRNSVSRLSRAWPAASRTKNGGARSTARTAAPRSWRAVKVLTTTLTKRSGTNAKVCVAWMRSRERTSASSHLCRSFSRGSDRYAMRMRTAACTFSLAYFRCTSSACFSSEMAFSFDGRTFWIRWPDASRSLRARRASLYAVWRRLHG
mmetsp:Transcript_1641/g.4235  ORF Transcript_1641/g.4235 Transcript_1641/m.4235 type:complete len:351 (-) Transcript_1641:670-1722(-)